MPKEFKTGQSTDGVKEGLIKPALMGYLQELKELPQTFSLIDIGTGDATTSEGLLTSLLQNGHRIENLALVDADIHVFPELLDTALSEPIAHLNTQILEAGKRELLQSFLEQYGAKYDIALLQLVAHQIESDAQLTYLEYLAYEALKADGHFLMINLHPAYLEYLSKNEPDKFTIQEKLSDKIIGTYHFDSSGSASVYSRNIEKQLAQFLGMGFDFVQALPITTEVLADKKPRYKKLADNDIPMFYLMHVKKNESNFVSSSKGEIKKILPHNDLWLTVIFADNDEIRIPAFQNWEKVTQGSILIVQETRREEIAGHLLNYWVVDPKENVTGGQMRVTPEKIR